MLARRRLFRAVPMIAVMGTIFFLSHQPGDAIVLPDVPDIDKVLHSLIYGVLAATTLYACSGKALKQHPGRVGILAVLFCLLYGISDEFHQSFIPGRCPSIWDIAADVVGAVVVVSLWWYKKGFRFRVVGLNFRCKISSRLK